MQKKKLKVNILDFLIIAIVILSIAGAFLRAYTERMDDKLNTTVATVSFKISNIQAASAKYFKSGANVHCETYDCDMGTLVGEVVTSPAAFYVEDGFGGIVKTYSASDRIDLEGKIECSGTMTKEGGFKLDGSQYIAPGTSVTIFLPQIAASVLITDIRIK